MKTIFAIAFCLITVLLICPVLSFAFDNNDMTENVSEPSISFHNGSNDVAIHKYQKYEVDYNDGGYPNTQIVYSVTGDLRIKEDVFSDNNSYVYVMTETGKGGVITAELVSEEGETLARCEKEVKIPFSKRIIYPLEGFFAAGSIATWVIGIISVPTIMAPFYYVYQLIKDAIS